MSAETLATVIAFAGFLVALGTGFGWMIRRSDAQFRGLASTMEERSAAAEAGLDARFAAIEARMDARFAAAEARNDARFAAAEARNDEHFREIRSRLDSHEHELTEIKIAIARLEGPRPHLITVR